MKTLIVKVMVAVAALSAVAAITSPSRAAASPEPGDPSCSLVASSDGFTVTWQGGPAGKKSVVSRKVGGRFWWRTALPASAGSFNDSVAPKNAGKVDYRVQFKNKSGAVVKTVGCDLPSSNDLCRATATSTGFEVALQDGLNVGGANVDYVIRRQVKQGGAYWWRARTSSETVADGPSPTGMANYQVWARVDKRIVAGANCVTGEASSESCFAERPQGQGDALVGKARPSAALLAEVQAVIPDKEIVQAIVGPEGRVHLLTYVQEDDGFVDVAVYDPATGSADLLVDQAGFSDLVELVFVDAAGGTYVEYSSKEGAVINRIGLDGASTFIGDIDSNFELIGHFPVGRLPDGKTVLGTWPGVAITDPGTFDPEPVVGLETYRISGVAADGRLLVSKDGSSFYYDLGCAN